jgi:Tol biopolymer transport system component
MRYSILRIGMWMVCAAALIGSLSTPASAQKESVWQKIQKAAQPGQPQPAGQTQPQPGQRPAKPGQQPTAGSSENNYSGPFTPPAGTKVDQAVMAPIEQGAQFAASPVGIHVATIAHKGSRQVVIYDGVEGPVFEQMFGQDGVHPVIFSHDGTRWAYCAQSGNDWVVMLDGKEVARSSESFQGRISADSCRLYFSPNSKHFYYTSFVNTDTSHGAARLVYDGKASPLGFSADMRDYVFSPDGDHFAYVWMKEVSRTQAQPILIVDNKPMNIPGGNPQWSADSKHLFTSLTGPAPTDRGGSVMEVLLDGKPYMKAQNITLTIPPLGEMVVARIHQTIGVNPLKTADFLVVGGNKVQASEVISSATTVTANIQSVAISPDGKHYAATYGDSNQRHWAFCDGKRGLDYVRLDNLTTPQGPIGPLAFTADSSKVVYVGFNGTKQFLVIGNQETELTGLTTTVIPAAGSHVATDGIGVSFDGRMMNFPNLMISRASALYFSPDGSHYAFVFSERGNVTLYLDGVPQSAFSPTLQGQIVNMTTRPFVFSPDSNHIAYFCRSADPAAGNDQGLCVDGKYARLGGTGTFGNLIFTSDSNHLAWTQTTGPNVRIFVDGKPVSEGFATATSGYTKETWQTTTDGSVLVLIEDQTNLKRLTITPSPSTSIATLTGGTTTLASGR